MVWDCCVLLCGLDWKGVFRFLDGTYSWLSYAIDWCRRVQNSMSLFQKFSIDQDGLNYPEMVHWSRALHNRLRSSGKLKLIGELWSLHQSIYRARDLIKAKLHSPFSPRESWEIAGVMLCLVQWSYNSSGFKLFLLGLLLSPNHLKDRRTELRSGMARSINRKPLLMRLLRWDTSDFSKYSDLKVACVCHSTFLLNVHTQTFFFFLLSFRTSGKWYGWVT